MLRAIKMRTKFDALLTKLAQAAQAEDLETAAVREYGARPGSETVKPAVPANELMPGTEVEVIGISKNNGGADGSQVIRSHGLDRADCSYRHENRRRNIAVRRMKNTGPGPAVLTHEFKNM